MKKTQYFLIWLVILTATVACKKNNSMMSDLEKLRNSNNAKSYPAVQMDSMQAINSITKQKVQDVLDLSTLYLDGHKNTSIDSAMYRQIEAYFYKPDSTTLRPLFREMESLKVKSAVVNRLQVYKTIHKKDTLDYAKFNVEYFDGNNRSLGSFDRNAQYVLVSAPIKFKKEFKFYFINIYSKPLKDSTVSGVTR
ncbi:hypothetical protein [Daejeonia sp. YH14]|uniref:hypothetical protein n=1 Tax=Daejeonia sp. YH14 TaxID=3439042 RepID=UPI003F4942BA